MATCVGAATLGWALTGPIGGVLVLAAAIATTRVARARPLLTIGGPTVLVGSVAAMAAKQLFGHLPPGFDWPTYFEALQTPAWIAVLLVALDAVVERCWSRRWWPADRSD
ncbi:MAG: hypothetical protein R2701_11265 [Acidimicrobiales bacterium]